MASPLAPTVQGQHIFYLGPIAASPPCSIPQTHSLRATAIRAVSPIKGQPEDQEEHNNFIARNSKALFVKVGKEEDFQGPPLPLAQGIMQALRLPVDHLG